MTALEVLIKKIDELIVASQESIGEGVAKDYAEYQNACGFIKGLWTARREITDLEKKLENSDE